MEQLSRIERYFLSNQLRILEALYPDEARDYAIRREAVEAGYQEMYDMHMEHIYDGDEVLSADECREVWDVLDMFHSIDFTIESLEGENNYCLKDQSYRYWARFKGYDGNNEGKFMWYARFIVEKLGRYEGLKLERGSFNSHTRVRTTYKEMLWKWKEIDASNRFPMSQSDLERVLTHEPLKK